MICTPPPQSVCRYRAPELLLGTKSQTTALDMWWGSNLWNLKNIDTLYQSTLCTYYILLHKGAPSVEGMFWILWFTFKNFADFLSHDIRNRRVVMAQLVGNADVAMMSPVQGRGLYPGWAAGSQTSAAWNVWDPAGRPDRAAAGNAQWKHLAGEIP